MGDDNRPDSPDDLDYIGEEGAGGAWSNTFTLRSGRNSPPPVFVPKASTPLQEDIPDAVIPTFALWSMKYLRRAHLFGRGDGEVREAFGEGDAAIYVMDDGRKHCLVSRKVGTSPDGCTYCLVGHISMTAFDELVDGARPDAVFSSARTLSLCAVFEAHDEVSNVAVCQEYGLADDVPNQYLPPHPSVTFTEPP